MKGFNAVNLEAPSPKNEKNGINALNLEPTLFKNDTDDSPKLKMRKDFEQHLKQQRQRLARVDEDKVANAGVGGHYTQEAQPVHEERSEALSPRSDLSDSASAESDVVAGLYFLLAASLRPESEGESAYARPTSAVTCPSLDLESDAEDESVGSSAEEK